MRAHRLIERALQSNMDLKNETKIGETVHKEYEELQRAIAEEDKERIGILVGELLFSLANLARHFGSNAEDALRGANKKFIESQTP